MTRVCDVDSGAVRVAERESRRCMCVESLASEPPLWSPDARLSNWLTLDAPPVKGDESRRDFRTPGLSRSICKGPPKRVLPTNSTKCSCNPVRKIL